MAVCPNCGAYNNDGAKFCTSCGGPLPVAQPVQQPAQQPVQQPVQQYQQPVQQQYQQPVPIQPQPVYQPEVPQPIQPVYAQPIKQPVMQRPKTNGLCQAGFVLSIIGWFTMGITCPLGFLFSLIGLIVASSKKQPGKGKAIAGLIMSGIIMLSIGITVGIAWNDIKKDIEDGNITGIEDIMRDIDNAGDRYSGSTTGTVKKITDEEWVEMTDGSYLTFGKGSSFTYTKSKDDPEENYTSGKYKIYLGNDAIDQITVKYKKYGVTKDEINSMVKSNSVFEKENCIFIVFNNEKRVEDGEDAKVRESESVLYGFVLDYPSFELMLVDMKTQNSYVFVRAEDYEKVNSATVPTFGTTDATDVTDETDNTDETEETTTADPNAKTMGNSTTGTVTLTQGKWADFKEADGDSLFEARVQKVNMETNTIIGLCVYAQKYKKGADKTLADSLAKNLKAEGCEGVEVQKTKLGGNTAYSVTGQYPDGTILNIWVFLDKNNKMHYITIEYFESDKASYNMVKDTYKFG